MASTYSTSLKIQLMGNGEDSGTWGSITNTNWNLIEQAVSGVQTITMSNADYTLSNLNGVSDEARNAVLVIQGTNSAVRNVIAPLVTKTYIVSNQTTGGYAITIGGNTGAIVSIPNGITASVYCDGVNFYSALIGLLGNQTVSGNLTVNGTLSATTITASVNYVGPGTGLTGTATTLSIGGNAATATTATTATSAAAITNSGGWSVTPSGTKLYFNYNGTNVASLDSSGNLIALANITAYGTP